MPPKDPRLPDSPFTPRANPTPTPSSGPRGAKFAKLDALFKGGGAPSPAPPAPARPAPAMGSRMRMERLRGAHTPDEIVAAADALVKNHEMPDEAELLCKMLQHPDAAVGERALAQLGSQHKSGKLVVSGLVRDALEAFEPRCKEPLARALLQELLGSR
ncbi:MAG: hypothetical protein AB2A00_05575 [Myxococcota bacterium]